MVLAQWKIATSQSFSCFGNSCINGIVNLILKHCSLAYVQFSGINGVLYYTPQILEEAGVEDLLADLGLSSESASFLISAFTTFLMLPCIAVGMRLMDTTGRR